MRGKPSSEFCIPKSRGYWLLVPPVTTLTYGTRHFRVQRRILSYALRRVRQEFGPGMATTENPYTPPSSDLVDATYIGTADIAASRMRRLGAVLLDLLILVVLQVSTILLIDHFSGSNIFQEAILNASEEDYPWFEINLLSAANYIGLAIDAIVFFFINGYLLAKRGQSIGKVIVNIAIVNVDTQRVQPMGRLIMLRYAPIYMLQAVMAFVYFLVFTVDALFVFRRDRRTLHDMMAGTTVIDLKLQERLRRERNSAEITDSNQNNPEDL